MLTNSKDRWSLSVAVAYQTEWRFTRYPSSLHMPYPGTPCSSSLHGLKLLSGRISPLLLPSQKSSTPVLSYSIPSALCQGLMSAQLRLVQSRFAEGGRYYQVGQSISIGRLPLTIHRCYSHNRDGLKPPPSWQRKDSWCSGSCSHRLTYSPHFQSV